MTVGVALDMYLQEHARRVAVDWKRQENAAQHLKAHLGDSLLGDIDIPRSREYVRARLAGENAPARAKERKERATTSAGTLRRELNVLMAAAKHALKWKRIKADELPRVELPSPPPPSDTAWMTKAQIGELLATATGDLHDFILIAYYTAARRASVETLTVGQVDLRLGRINFHTPGARVTKKRRAIVPLFPEIRPIIELRILAAGRNGRLFRTEDFYKPFVAAAAAIGVEAHPHMLRHSRATHMLMDGDDPYKVAKLLGDTLATVERVYGHASVEYLETESRLA